MDKQTNNQTTQEIHTEETPNNAFLVTKDKPLLDVFDHHKMLATLYFLLDAFERAQIEFFLVRQTAHDAKESHQLRGKMIHVGVRNNEWINGNQELLFPYFDQEHVELKSELPNELTYEWQGVPFTIHFYENNECLMALTKVTYEYEAWNIPNQFERFEKEFDTV